MKPRHTRTANVTKYLENEWTILKTVSSSLLYLLYMKCTKILQGMEIVCLSLCVSVYYLFLPMHILKKNQGIDYNDIKPLRNQTVGCTLCILWDVQNGEMNKMSSISSDFSKWVQLW